MRRPIVALLFLTCLAIQAQPASGPAAAGHAPGFGPQWDALIGDWIAESVAGGGGGRCSFRFDLGQHVLVRTNHAESAAGDGRPAGLHDDLTIIYPGSGEDRAQAMYWDNEGHVIEYVATWAADGNTLTFLSKPGPGPQFRLTYKKADADTWTVAFEMAPPGGASAFQLYTAGKIRRTAGGSASTDTAAFPVTIRVDASAERGELRPVWRFFGYDEPNFTYMKDGRKLLAELGRLGSPQVFVRTHHLLTSGDGSPALKWGSTGIYTEDAEGRPVYNWTIVDRIFDTYLERGLKPYVQLGFMPEALSSHPEDYPHDPPFGKMVQPGSGFSYPPKDYAKWGELCCQWARHCGEMYGWGETAQWWWEVWNEPNISYWKGTPEAYHRLYDFAVDGVRRALPQARVGGPETAGGPGGKFLRNFLEHCLRGTNYATGKVGSPLDFVAFHAKGSPKFERDHVRMGIANQLRDIDAGFATVAAFPELRRLPVVIGESDPEGCAACQGPQLGYRNGTMYSSYTAASFARKYLLADRHGVNFEGALTWAFEFENQPFFAGFRVLASNGIDLPVLNVFRMFAKMTGRRVAVTSSAEVGLDKILANGVREGPDVSALASLDAEKLCVMAWHYHDDDLPGPAAEVTLTLAGLPLKAGEAELRLYRIDGDHSNAFAAWKRMGSPAQPDPEQYAKLEKAGQLDEAAPPQTLAVDGAQATIHLTLPRQGVALAVLHWQRP